MANLANMHIMNFLLFILINFNPFKGIMQSEDEDGSPLEVSSMLPAFQVLIVLASWMKMGQIFKRARGLRSGLSVSDTSTTNAMEWFETFVCYCLLRLNMHRIHFYNMYSGLVSGFIVIKNTFTYVLVFIYIFVHYRYTQQQL